MLAFQQHFAWMVLDPTDGINSTQLVIRGLSQHGFLRAEDANGKMYELTPDGNSLDMMQGLLRRKL